MRPPASLPMDQMASAQARFLLLRYGSAERRLFFIIFFFFRDWTRLELVGFGALVIR